VDNLGCSSFNQQPENLCTCRSLSSIERVAQYGGTSIERVALYGGTSIERVALYGGTSIERVALHGGKHAATCSQ
jgi:hypothetical protein